MDENPYQPPQSQPEIRPSRKAIVGMSVLGVLSVPAGAIAGSAICTGVTLTTGASTGLLGVGLGFVVAFAISVAGLVFWNTPGVTVEQMSSLMAWLAQYQLLALPLAVLVGIVGHFLAYDYFSRRNRGEGTELAIFLISLVVYSVTTVSVYITWRHWAERELPGPNGRRDD